MQRTARALSLWLAPAYGGNLRLVPDLDQVDALSPEREALWSRMERTSFLTSAEKRAAVGYGETGKGAIRASDNEAGTRTTRSIARKYREDQARDDQGRWVEEGDRAGNDDDEESEPELIPTASRGPAKPPTPPPKSPPKTTDPQKTPKPPLEKTPGGREYTDHAQQRASERNFTPERIDAIVDNNARSRVGKVDAEGKKTWEYRDNRGNTVVTNESGGVVTVFSPGPRGAYIERP